MSKFLAAMTTLALVLPATTPPSNFQPNAPHPAQAQTSIPANKKQTIILVLQQLLSVILQLLGMAGK